MIGKSHFKREAQDWRMKEKGKVGEERTRVSIQKVFGRQQASVKLGGKNIWEAKTAGNHHTTP